MMSAHKITPQYLEKVARKVGDHATPASLKPGATWAHLGLNSDDKMRRLAGALQNLAADFNDEAELSTDEVAAAKDVAGGLVVTWKAAGLRELKREEAIAEIEVAQSEMTVEVIVTGTRKKRPKKRKKTVRKKSPRAKRRTKRSRPSRPSKETGK